MASNVTRDHHRWTRNIDATSIANPTVTLKDTVNSSFTFKSDGAAAPQLTLSGINQETFSCPIFNFIAQRDTDTDSQVGDATGVINFKGYDDGTPSLQTYSQINSEIHVVTDGEESGKLELKVASHDGGLENGLILTGGSEDTEVDVTIGNGTSSLTTVAGNLDIDGNTITTAGAITLDSAGAIDLDAHTGRFAWSLAGTAFNPTHAGYAGMILGYAYISNSDMVAGDNTISLTSSMDALQTVNGTDLKVRFTVPPSGNVEIEFSCMLYASSREITFSLSTGATGSYSALHARYEYDDVGIKPDETDYIVANPKWVVTGLTAGTDITLYIAAKSSTNTSYIYH